MKILMLCGVFAPENEQEILQHAKRPVEYSANVFQKKLIRGFCEAGHPCSVISAPFIGSYPNASSRFYFKGFEAAQDQYEYVPFLNVWGLRNLSRSAALKRAVADFIGAEDAEKLIVVYSAHTPFLEAAVYAKRRDPRIKLCLVLPDLPQYMNLNAHISLLYKVGKRLDIARFRKLNREVDHYILLTEAMQEAIDLHGRPYRVVEGIVDEGALEEPLPTEPALSEEDVRYIVYTGKTNEKFGIRELVDAFGTLKDPKLRLVICGSGDGDPYIAEKAAEDGRILAQGQVSHDRALSWIRRADVLVNPRWDNGEYTKYSFPSKNIEYLSCGKPTVGYVLRGMKPIYREFMFAANEEGLAPALTRALNAEEREQRLRFESIKAYMHTLSGKNVALRIVDMMGEGS